MKVILLLVIIAVAIGVYFSVTQESRSKIELTEELTQQVLAPDDSQKLETDPIEQLSTPSKPVYTQIQGENGNVLNGSKYAESALPSKLGNDQNSRIDADLQDDIGGVYDPDAIAPEDESVQNFYDDDVMQAIESDGLAPEEGTEMMPSGDGNPMFAESIDEAKAPESMDNNY